MGGLLGSGAGTDLSFVNTVSMTDGLAQALDLMCDVVRRPAFAAAEIDRQRSQAVSSLKVAAEDPDTVASQVIDRLVFGFHPYGVPSSGTAASLATLTRDDFVDFHKAWFVPNNALIAIVGDVPADDAYAQVQRVFGDWARGEVPAFAPTEPPPPVKRVVVIDKPGLGADRDSRRPSAIARKHPDHLVLDQVVKILGGEGGNRLQQVLRIAEEASPTAPRPTSTPTSSPAASSPRPTPAPRRRPRRCAPSSRSSSALQRERVYEGELEGAQDFLAGSFPLSIESPDAIATRVLNQLFYELPLEDLPAYPERVRSVTPDDVQRVAKTWLKPAQLSVVLVGDAAKFIEPARRRRVHDRRAHPDRGARPVGRRPAATPPGRAVAALAAWLG